MSEVAEKINMNKDSVTHVIRRLCVKSILTRQCGGKNKQKSQNKQNRKKESVNPRENSKRMK
jgi:predicted transcriptional regulator